MRRKISAPQLAPVYLGTGISASTFLPRQPKPIAKTIGGFDRIPKFSELSNAFNDFNTEFRKVRFHPQTSSLQNFDTWGSGGRGYQKATQWKPIQLGVFKVKDEKHVDRLIDEEDVEEQQQLDSMYNDEGQDIRGFRKTNSNKAKAEVKRSMQNVNLGVNSGEQDKKGAFGSGQRMREQEKKQFKSDSLYKKYVEDDDEFKQIANPEPVSKGRTKDKFINSEQNQ